MPQQIPPVMIGGALGSTCRFLIGQWGQDKLLLGTQWPIGTFCANLLGCFLIGLLYSLSQETPWLSPTARLLIMTGFLGALTTFSTFELENYLYASHQAWGQLFAYLASSILLGLLLLWLGARLGHWLTQWIPHSS